MPMKTPEHHQIAVVHNHWIHYKDLLFRAMAARGLDFIALFTAGHSARRRDPGPPEHRAYPYWIAHDGPYETVRQFAIARKMWRALGPVRPSCVIISGWYDAAAWSAWLWSRAHRVPMILWAESNIFDRSRHAPLEAIKRIYARPFRAAHVYGRSNAEYLLKLGVPRDRIFTKRAVLDTGLFQPRPRTAPRPPYKTMIFVGRLSPEKNLHRLLLALGQVPQDAARPRLVLRIVGYGPLEQALRCQVARLALEPFVELRGAAAQRELPAIYSAADALVLPSTSEPWGLVVNEAMCCGLPVLVSNRCGCAADLVTPETGWTLDPTDVPQLASTLEWFAGVPPARLAEMGEAARAVACQYSPANCAAIVSESVRAVLASASARGPAFSCPAPQ